MKGTALQAAAIYQNYGLNNKSSIIIIDFDGTINYIDDNFYQLSGYSKKELLGMNHKLLNFSKQSKSYLISIYKAIKKGHIWHDEVKNRAKDGHYYWVDRTIVPFLDLNSNLQMYSIINIDITNEKKINNTLSTQTFAIDHHSIIAKTDVKGSITYVNDKFTQISGYSKDELIGKNHRMLNSGKQPKSYWKAMYEVVGQGGVWKDEVKNKAKDGSYYWVDTTVVPYIGFDGKPESYISIRTDITEQKELSSALNNHKFAMNQHVIIATTDAAGTITYVNDKFIEISGYSRGELIGQNHRMLNSENQPKSYWKKMYETVFNGNVWKDEVKNISKNGSYYWVDTSIVPFINHKGNIDSYISIRTDITYQKKIEEILSNQRFAMDQHSIIAITDIYGIITYANEKFCKISGYKEEELIGQDHRILNSGNQPKEYWEEMYKTLKEKGVWQDEVKNKAKNGEYYWVDTTIIPFLDSNGKPDCYISIRTDISKFKKVQEELEQYQSNLEKIVEERTLELKELNEKLKILSEIDSLTNLSNRRRLEIDFSNELKRGRRFDSKMAIFFLDLDDFKNINDVSGHEAGDALLRHVSNKMLQQLRGNEYLYRVGGDEFCIFIPNFNDKEELIVIAERLIKEITNIKFLDSIKIDIGCSIGISVFPENGETLSDLLSSADNAMYFRKKSGKNNFSFFK